MQSLIRCLFLFLLPVLLCFAPGDPADERIANLEKKLQALTAQVPGLNNKVDISVNGVNVQEFIRGIAVSNNLNVSVEPGVETRIYDNFANVSVIDVFLFLCQRYNLDITFIGNIMVFTKYTPPPPPSTFVAKNLNINWDAARNLIGFDFRNDSLSTVARELTKKTGKNIVYAPDLSGKLITAYIQDQPLDKALEKLAFANDLKITPSDNDFFMIERNDKNSAGQVKNNTANKIGLPNGVQLNTDNNLVSLDAVNAPIGELINAVSANLKVQYFLFTDIKGLATLHIKNATYEEFLKYVLNGTEFTFRKKNETYFIGDRNQEGLRLTKVIQLKYRTVDKVVDYIPSDLKKGVDVKMFPDLNSLIVSGSEPRIQEIEAFLREIDRVVPMVLIEVILMDVSNSHTLSTGIQAGVGNPPPASGTVLPGVDVNLDANAINNLISGLNGFGFITLGNVGPNFYLHLQAMEEQGILKIRSTPKLATLNGSEAKMSIGKTEYYKEQSNNVIGAQNPQNIITTTFKPVTADLSISIKPMVSGDDQVTLDITVKQSSFTTRFSPDAPPGTTQRTFESLVRVKNEQMILLGGLEEDINTESGKGTPFLSRIPLLKWLFSSRTKTKTKSRLSVLIRPTVIY
jgi:type IV pilus assembly protein PilQ